MLKNKKLSFMLITDSREKLRHFQLSYRVLLACALIAAFLFIANILLTTSFVRSQVTEYEVERLQSENSYLAQKLDKLQGQLGEISGMYDGLVKKEVAIRNMFNLPEVSLDERDLGIGGPENSALKTVSSAMQLANSAETAVEALLRLARFEREKYEEVYDLLTARKDALDHTPSIGPTRGFRMRGFGIHTDPFTGNKQFHHGVDISNRTGTAIYATADGSVEHAAFDGGGMGNLIVLDHGLGLKTRYAHLSKIKVMRGQAVKRGMLIGYMGSTGYSTGPHLHYEVLKNGRQVDPEDFIINWP